MKHKILKEEMQLPEKAQARIEGRKIIVKGPKGEVTKEFKYSNVTAKIEGNKIIIEAPNAKQKEKKNLYTLRAHVRNLIEGAMNGYIYRLKICSGHFPMTATVSGNQFIVKNFLGEKIPRVIKIKEGATVKVEGTEVTVESPDIETAGQVAADIELLTRVVGRDIRIFQDGIYITKKPA